MATLTIRKIPDEQIQQLKEVAEKNNRSMESQVRSILEECWLARWRMKSRERPISMTRSANS